MDSICSIVTGLFRLSTAYWVSFIVLSVLRWWSLSGRWFRSVWMQREWGGALLSGPRRKWEEARSAGCAHPVLSRRQAILRRRGCGRTGAKALEGGPSLYAQGCGPRRGGSPHCPPLCPLLAVAVDTAAAVGRAWQGRDVKA